MSKPDELDANVLNAPNTYGALEERSYLIGGELSAADWNALVAHLGYVGLAVKPPESPREPNHEAMIYDGPVVNRTDFITHAGIIEASPSTAGRAWNTLTHIYSRKVYADEFEQYAWSDRDKDSQTSLVFDYWPIPLPDRSLETIYAQIQGLRLESLKPLLDEVAESIERRGVRNGIPMILGYQNGIKVYVFLCSFYDSYMNHPIEETTDEAIILAHQSDYNTDDVCEIKEGRS